MSEQKPDLNENSSVLDAHNDLVDASAACTRENQVHENGMEPVSLWIILGCFIVAIIAGSVFGKSGVFGSKSYQTYVKPGYIQDPIPGGGPVEVQPLPIKDVFVKNGAKIYQAKCQGCHQPNGLGDGANFPPIGGSEWVTENTSALAQIILNGVAGPIEVAGRTWNGNMPGQATGMTDADLAALLTYLRNSFGNETGDVVTIEMASNAIAEYKKRGGGAPVPPQVKVAELKSKYMVNLEGEPVDPSLKIDPETLEPVE